ncbi:hypothetical protein [Citrifermentans bremense]|uniref:hypothetical protein n=1 Tax=Citrifermentans bremense TaxID=60035 RepID=UPI0012EC663D|nr:hypothetical protein [Citrifermentans bremense]
MMWVFLSAISLAMTFMRLGALTVSVMYFTVFLKLLVMRIPVDCDRHSDLIATAVPA